MTHMYWVELSIPYQSREQTHVNATSPGQAIQLAREAFPEWPWDAAHIDVSRLDNHGTVGIVPTTWIIDLD